MTRKYPVCVCGHSSDRHDSFGGCFSCNCDTYVEKNTKSNNELRAECNKKLVALGWKPLVTSPSQNSGMQK